MTPDDRFTAGLEVVPRRRPDGVVGPGHLVRPHRPFDHTTAAAPALVRPAVEVSDEQQHETACGGGRDTRADRRRGQRPFQRIPAGSDHGRKPVAVRPASVANNVDRDRRNRRRSTFRSIRPSPPRRCRPPGTRRAARQRSWAPRSSRRTVGSGSLLPSITRSGSSRPNGKLAETWGTPGSGDGQFNFNVGATTAGRSPSPRMAASGLPIPGTSASSGSTRTANSCPRGADSGPADGEFVYPNDISVDTVGTVFVADDKRHDIQVFTSDGQYLRSLKPASFVIGHRRGLVLTTILPDGRPGLTQYKPDGSYQGGIDMPDLMPARRAWPATPRRISMQSAPLDRDTPAPWFASLRRVRSLLSGTPEDLASRSRRLATSPTCSSPTMPRSAGTTSRSREGVTAEADTRSAAKSGARRPLDIERLFDAGCRQNRTDVPSPMCPDDGQSPIDCRRKEPGMAMIRVEPVEVHVRTGWFDGSPREITWGDERLPSPGSPPSARRRPHTRSSPDRGPCSRSRPPGPVSPSPISIARAAGRSRPSTRSDASGLIRLDRGWTGACPPVGAVGQGRVRRYRARPVPFGRRNGALPPAGPTYNRAMPDDVDVADVVP